MGIKGFPTDVLAERKEKFDYVYTCDPKIMMAKVFNIMNFKNVQVLAERYMKCEIGVCGSCALGNISCAKMACVLWRTAQEYRVWKIQETTRWKDFDI